ncbi:FadR family transcriptional regulator [Streptomyces reniochalinae]|uniref:FadR family transcriptional regulator n=1 Tax=Streptomyces reniochalinae TaxID=2250578 RepID=A0A367EDF4_9ACTN|nr:FadR family transcriptional regulator [Streptomyces reniochalinae]
MHQEEPAGGGTDAGAPGRRASALGPVKVASAVDEVADRLLTAIALGEFSVGERLPPERDLAAVLEVGRPTVRSAIGRLHESGCLEVVRGRAGGHYVRAGWREESGPAVRRTLLPRWERIRELFDTRALVESLVARTAAERCTEEDSRAIERALAAYVDAVGAGEPAGARRADGALHAAIGRAARNEPLVRYARQLLADIGAGFPIEPFRGDRVEQALADHRELSGAVVAGDADTAARVARRHFVLTEETLRAALVRSLPDEDAASL